MKVTINEVYPKLYHIEFPNQYIETASFIRIQEFYESSFPEIRGHYFTLEQYMDRYAKFKGNFTYNTDWSGFNLPGIAFDKFYYLFGVFNQDFLKKEDSLLNLVKEIVGPLSWSDNDYYIIATYKGEKNDLKHEIAHGLFYLNTAYKKEMLSLIKKYKTRFVPIEKSLKKMGYARAVIKDEIQAYLATGCAKQFKKIGNPYCKEFKQVFNKYYRKIKGNPLKQ